VFDGTYEKLTMTNVQIIYNYLEQKFKKEKKKDLDQFINTDKSLDKESLLPYFCWLFINEKITSPFILEKLTFKFEYTDKFSRYDDDFINYNLYCNDDIIYQGSALC